MSTAMKFTDQEVTMLIALAFALGIPGAFGALAIAFAVAKDGTPFTRDFWTAS